MRYIKRVLIVRNQKFRRQVFPDNLVQLIISANRTRQSKPKATYT